MSAGLVSPEASYPWYKGGHLFSVSSHGLPPGSECLNLSLDKDTSHIGLVSHPMTSHNLNYLFQGHISKYNQHINFFWWGTHNSVHYMKFTDTLGFYNLPLSSFLASFRIKNTIQEFPGRGKKKGVLIEHSVQQFSKAHTGQEELRGQSKS